MNPSNPSVQTSAGPSPEETHTQLLLLPDGRLLVHNLTPAMAEILHKLDPWNPRLQLCRLIPQAPLRATDP